MNTHKNREDHWPSRWTRKGKTIYYVPRADERDVFDGRTWVRLGGSEPEAFATWARIEPMLDPLGRDTGGSLPIGASGTNWIKPICLRARSNATKHDIGYELTSEDEDELARASQGRCALTRIRFDFSDTKSAKGKRPLVASLDRIDREGIYEIGNVRLILAALNIAIGPWGEDLYGQIAMAYLSEQRRAVRKNLTRLDFSIDGPHGGRRK